MRINLGKVYKRVLLLLFAIYVVYTFIMQQQTLNAYKAEKEQYTQEIQQTAQKCA